MFELNLYQSALAIGGCIIVLFILAYVATWLGQCCYAWLDDAKTGEQNLIVKFLSEKVFKYKVRDKETYRRYSYVYTSKMCSEGSDGFAPFFCTMMLCAVAPLIIVIVLDFLFAALVILGFIVAAHLARFCFRHRKLFDKHIKDKDAHQ